MKHRYIYEDGICFINMEKIDKEERDFIKRVPYGHSILTEIGLFRKTGIFNPSNPHRASFLMIFQDDYVNVMTDKNSALRKMITI